MKSITFQIHYQTEWGQQLAVVSQADASEIFPLQYLNNGWWQATLKIEEAPKILTYQYVIIDNQQNILQEEWGEARRFSLGSF